MPTLPEDIFQATDVQKSYRTYCLEQGIGYPTDQIHGDDVNAAAPAVSASVNGKALSATGVSSVPLAHSLEVYTADQAIEFVKRPKIGNGNQPFFLSLSFDRPHAPWTPSPEDADLYDPESILLPETLTEDELALMPAYVQEQIAASSLSVSSIGEAGLRTVMAHYYALCTRIDAEIGRVLDALREQNLDENTLIVFTTDHGDMSGQLGLFDKYANHIYRDDIIRVPLLVRLPGNCSENRVVRENVELVRLFPTLLELTGMPDDSLPLDGEPLPGLAANTSGDASEVPAGSGRAFSESYGLKAVMKDGWKMVHYVQGSESMGELYDLRSDPGERRNRFLDPACQGKRVELLQELVDWLTPRPSSARQEYLRWLLNDRTAHERGELAPLFKWEQGIIEGGGFWFHIRDDRRLTVVPFDGICRLEQLDSQAPTDGCCWNYEACDDAEALLTMVTELVDYLCGKIRPVSIMSGNAKERERMLFASGHGYC